MKKKVNSGKSKKKISKFIYWMPRIVSIILLFLLVMLSGDVFDEGLSFWQTVGALFLHNIPVFVLLTVLIISWKHEIVGGIVFILAGLLFIIFTIAARNPQFDTMFETIMISMTLSVPALLIGILFLIGWYKKKK